MRGEIEESGSLQPPQGHNGLGAAAQRLDAGGLVNAGQAQIRGDLPYHLTNVIKKNKATGRRLCRELDGSLTF